MVGDMRKSLDSMGELTGFAAGEVRTRRFRHTYCSARLQTVNRIRLSSHKRTDVQPINTSVFIDSRCTRASDRLFKYTAAPGKW